MKRMVGDGEHFDVTERIGEPGVHELRWISGPNEGFGLATAKYGGERSTDAELEDAIRTFLGQVDHATGCIE